MLYCLLYVLYLLYVLFSHYSSFNSCVRMHWHWLAVVPDDDPLPLEDPAGVRTPPTPPVVPTHSPSPPPLRQRAMAQLRPVSIPDLVSNMAGKETALETLIAADGEGDCKGIEVNIWERAKV